MDKLEVKQAQGYKNKGNYLHNRIQDRRSNAIQKKGEALVAIMDEVKEAEGSIRLISFSRRTEMENEVRERSLEDFKQIIKELKVHKSFGTTIARAPWFKQHLKEI